MRLGAVVAGLACVVAVAAGGAEQPRPNVLFLIADDLATPLGCYGDATAITPNRTAFMLGLTKLQEDEPQPDGTSLRRNFSHFGVGDGPEQMHDAQVADRAIEFLATRRDASKPFFAAVSLLDAEVGRILTALDAQGLCQDTVVVFTSDHGYHLGWRGQWVKHTISEQVLNVPLIVRAPGAAAGAKADGIVELIDLFPTFCDVAGIATPDHLDGTSFQPLLRNPASAGKPAAFIAMPKGWGNGRSVRTVRFRYVERNDGSVELYDHASDPDEYHNVAADPAHAAVIREHAVLLEQTFGQRKARQERRRAG